MGPALPAMHQGKPGIWGDPQKTHLSLVLLLLAATISSVASTICQPAGTGTWHSEAPGTQPKQWVPNPPSPTALFHPVLKFPLWETRIHLPDLRARPDLTSPFRHAHLCSMPNQNSERRRSTVNPLPAHAHISWRPPFCGEGRGAAPPAGERGSRLPPCSAPAAPGPSCSPDPAESLGRQLPFTAGPSPCLVLLPRAAAGLQDGSCGARPPPTSLWPPPFRGNRGRVAVPAVWLSGSRPWLWAHRGGSVGSLT